MSERTIDTLQHQFTNAGTRRASLVTVAALALMTTISRATSASVADSSKKSKKLKTKKCKKQVGQCTAALQEACAGNSVCESSIPCCGLLANCNATEALLCIFTV